MILRIKDMFDFHKEKPPPCVRFIGVCAGRPYVSFIFQKARTDFIAHKQLYIFEFSHQSHD